MILGLRRKKATSSMVKFPRIDQISAISYLSRLVDALKGAPTGTVPAHIVAPDHGAALTELQFILRYLAFALGAFKETNYDSQQ